MGMKLQLLSMVEAECPDVVVAAARAGDTESLTKFLQKYPDEVLTYTIMMIPTFNSLYPDFQAQLN